MPQCDTWDAAYRDKKTTPTETEYGKTIEYPRADIDDIVTVDKYIDVTVKLDDGTNIGGNIAAVKRCAADENVFAIGRVHNNPLLDTR